MKITDEQLFDYHLGLLSQAKAAQLQEHLEQCPEDQKRLQSIQNLESNYSQMTWEEPSEAVLYQVRQAARDQVSTSLWTNFTDHFQNYFTVKKLSLSFTAVFVVVGLSYALKTLQSQETLNGSLAPVEQAASFSGSLTQETLTEAQGSVPSDDVLNQYNQAMVYYHQNELARAANLYEKIAISSPDFDKKKELYAFWILALRKMGQNDKADQIEASLK